MSKPNFTPGPWGFGVEGNPVALLVRGRGPHSPSWIAEVAESENQIANARLIAAAPDLFEALRTILYDIDVNKTRGLSFEGEKLARAALAKAEGKV